MHGFISGLYILFHWYIFLFLCPYHTVLMTVAFQYNLKSGSLIPPAPFFFLKAALVIRGLLCFHMNCGSFCSSSVKNVIGNLIGIILNLQNSHFHNIDFCYPGTWNISPSVYVVFDFLNQCHHFLCTVILFPQLSLFLDI